MASSISNRLRKNIRLFSTWFIPLIIISKIVRWTIMYDRLVMTSMGHGMVIAINKGGHEFIMNFVDHSSNIFLGIPEQNTIAFCENINVFDISTYLGWEIFFTLFFNILIWKTMRNFYKSNLNVDKLSNTFIYLSIIVLNIFCLNLAKEPYQLIFWFLIMYAIIRPSGLKKKYIFLFIALTVTIMLSRKYYALTALFFIFIRIIMNFMLNANTSHNSGIRLFYKVIITIIFVGGLFYVSILFMNMYGMSEVYELLAYANSMDRNNGEVDSMIVPLFGTASPILMTLENIVKVFRLMFPLELLIKPKATYLVLIVYQILLCRLLFKAIKNRTKNTYEKNFALDLYLAFLCTSAAFEPDFGSWLRHESVTFPILLYLIPSDFNKRKKYRNNYDS